MGKNLVIVESPAKAKTINKILGGDFVVKASMGHVRDLPLKKLGVDIEHDFAPEYVVVKGREKIIGELTKAAKDAESVYLAPDPDREGEAIAWHLEALLKEKAPNANYVRVSYNEITPRAVRAAFDHPAGIDRNRVDAQQARRVLDRIVGYKVSPLLWSRVKRGLSAGRVQSVALRLVCEREDEITKFVPAPYWIMGALVRKQEDPRDPFRARLSKIDGETAEITSEERAKAIAEDLDDRAMRVTRLSTREISKRPFPPHITSTLQQGASTVCGFSPSRTMRIAQDLYEGVELGEGPVGLITYMRTDSFSIAKDAQQACLEMIAARFGREYVPENPNVYRSRSGAQEAHEAIRPTDVTRTPESLTDRLTPDQMKLYALIWKRFVASQMAPAKIEQRAAEIEAVPPEGKTSTYLFRASASRVLFPGYMQVTGVDATAPKEKDKDREADEEEQVEQLPTLREGEALDRIEWLSERKETQPPGRYSEASLVRALEANGVGRPSTYAAILSTLNARRYVDLEKRSLRPTELGMRVFRLLVESLNELFDVKFTASMEESLDEIENGKVAWAKMLADFYARFVEWMKQAKGPSADPAKVGKLLEALKGVTAWGPEVKRGRRTYSDRRFADSIGEKLAENAAGISMRQLEALARIAARYGEQVPTMEGTLGEVGFGHFAGVPQGPSPSTIRKLEILKLVTCEEPTERRGRTYDDRKFIDSVASQAAMERDLSPAQIGALDRLLMKYGDQIPNFEATMTEIGIALPSAADGAETAQLLETFRAVTEWKPAVQRGRRVMDDKVFYDSLSSQFARKRSLSPKQVAALKKLAKRYQLAGAAEGEGAAEGDAARKEPDAG